MEPNGLPPAPPPHPLLCSSPPARLTSSSLGRISTGAGPLLGISLRLPAEAGNIFLQQRQWDRGSGEQEQEQQQQQQQQPMKQAAA